MEESNMINVHEILTDVFNVAIVEEKQVSFMEVD
jgi:hypothetical protein